MASYNLASSICWPCVEGLSRYLTALGLLFDPATSSVDLYNIEVASPTTITARSIQLPGCDA
jgi:hypothetical protein